MGHYVLHHLLWGFALTVGGLLALLPLAQRFTKGLLARFGPRWGVAGPTDIAATPALLLTASLFGFLLAPVTNGASRVIEHQADAYGLGVTGDRPAMARAFVSLAEQNLSDPDPPAFIRFWLFSHPPLRERIAFALGRKSARGGE
jgi:Zn-dependent protease with chaperone function